MNETLTVDQVAASLGFHPKTVRQLIRSGKLKATRIGKQWRILTADLDAFLGVAASPMSLQTGISDKPLVTAVVDLEPDTREEYIRITNTLTAIFVSKSESDGYARLNHTYFESEGKARLMLYGSLEFIGKTLICIGELTKK